MFAQVLPTLLILAVCSLAPGFAIVRRFRWSAMEKLCGAAGLSLALVWLAGWLLYLAGANGPAGCLAITGICAVLGAIAWSDLRRLFGAVRVRQAALGFGFLLLWTVIALTIIRNYSGAGWSGDWLEQFSRSLFFLHHFPKDSEMFGGYRITSRPPGLNVIAAFTMAQAGDRFEVFQATYTFLNLLLFLPCCLIMPVLGRARKGAILVLTGIFACSPFVIVNATYTGAKSFAAFYVVLGIAFYLAGWRKQDRVRTVAGFLALAAGLVAHYSAAPYCIFFALHYLFVVFPKRADRWKELAAIAGVSGALMLAWFGWTVATYGVHGTVMAPVNTSVAYGPKDESGYVLKFIANLFDTTVPHVLRTPSLMHAFDQPSLAGYVRDNAFVIYQTNLIFAMGIFGGPVVVWFLIRALRNPATKLRSFWLSLIAFSVMVGLVVVGERDYFGVGHLTQLAMFAIGLTLLAARFGSKRWVAMLIVAGCAIDFGLGVFFQARVEHLENTTGHTVFSGLTLSNAGIDVATPGAESLSSAAWGNWFRKHQYALSERWSRELAGFRPNDPAAEQTKAAIRPTLEQSLRDEGRVWHGWYRNHGGEIVFLGDHFGDSDATSVVMLLLAMGLLWKMGRRVPRPRVIAAAPSPARKPRSSRSRYK
ncbi:MAG TPA: hypothetical protein VMS37_08125 [Verrucomicrobiae bacterium]|nr:hypothetical protein [Verrucomicrobiae bacterium]